MTPTRVLVVQDNPLLATTIVEILERVPGLSVLAVALTGAAAVAVTARDKATVVLMDFHLPDMSGPAAAILIQEMNPGVPIVFHSAEESEAALLDAIDAGATAYLTRSATADEILDAVQRASRGEVLIPVPLFVKAISRQRAVVAEAEERSARLAVFTPRELDVLRTLTKGLDTQAIGRHLGIADHTVEWHVRHLIEKLQVHSKLQAVVAAVRLGIIEL